MYYIHSIGMVLYMRDIYSLYFQCPQEKLLLFPLLVKSHYKKGVYKMGVTLHVDCCYPISLSKEGKNSWRIIIFSFTTKVTRQVKESKNTETISTGISIIPFIFLRLTFANQLTDQNILQEKHPRLRKTPRDTVGFVCLLESL